MDVGHSSTHVIPVWQNQILSNGIRRAEVGGKLISKFLKESISLNQFDISKHFFLANDIKDKCCIVTTNPSEFLDKRVHLNTPKLKRLYYALNDYEIYKKGYLIDSNQLEEINEVSNLRNVINLQIERVIFPEILFQPSM